MSDSTSRQVFLTGASGMLGSQITRFLIRKGYSVRALVQAHDLAPTLRGLPKVECVEGDITQPDQLLPLIKGSAYVIHAAAMAGSLPTRSSRYFEVNVAGTRHLMEAALAAQVKRVIFISSSSAAGFSSSKIHPGQEDTPWKGDMGLDYVKSKFEADQLVASMVREKGLPAVHILPGFMIGPYDAGPSSGQLLVKAWNQPFKFCTAGGKNFVYNGDVAAAVVNALEMGRIGERYLCGGQNLTFRALFRLIEETIGIPQSNLILPPWLAVGVARGLKGLAKLTGSPPLLTPEMARNANQKIFYSSQKAHQELDMPQTDIRDALREAYTWFDQNGYLKSYENTIQSVQSSRHHWSQYGYRQDYGSQLS